MVFQFDEPDRIGDAWTLPIEGGTPARVTGVYDSLASEYALPRQEKVTWKGADGVTIEGILFYPFNYEAGKRYPLVVQLHGGPQDSDKFGFGVGVLLNYVPVLTGKGYAVLRPNYRGSSGYGNAFLRDVTHNYFNNMHLDVMAGVDAVIRNGVVDPDRLAVMGWSAGGHLTNKLITFTNRFKAASSGAGGADWISFFSQTDARSIHAEWFGGFPWQKGVPIEPFWNNSPLKDVGRVRTPTLLFAGEDDDRIPAAQAREMYRGLVAAGVETRLYIAPREGHQWRELRHQIRKANSELEWFDRYVLGRPYTWEQAPADHP
jgi:dipeptidyl aminopeptidase/acylaminoacyl peptidase